MFGYYVIPVSYTHLDVYKRQYQKDRAVDEMPQSAAGRTIMTTEPKFVPEEAVEVNIGENASFRVRMIDCVGYICLLYTSIHLRLYAGQESFCRKLE